MLFAFFDEDGRIKQAHNDETVAELPDGAVALSVEQWGSRFDLRLQDGVLVLDPLIISPDMTNELVWNKIKAERERRRLNGFSFAGKWYHSDGESKIQHLANKDTARDQLEAGGHMDDPLLDPVTGQAIVWKTLDGSWQPLTCQIAFDIVRAGKAAEFATFAAAEAHRAAMLASQDPAAYDFTAGWPAVFGE